MKYLFTMPRGPVTKKISSHKGAQGWIYFSMCQELDLDVTMNDGTQNLNDYDALILYHGNDWFGSLNLFGGMTKDNGKGFYDLSQFQGKIYSCGMDFPDYHAQIQKRIDSKAKRDPIWEVIDVSRLEEMMNESITMTFPNLPVAKHFIAGDSHAIGLYRPGYAVNSVPFTTLNGALNKGLETFLVDKEFDSIGFYFGAIDIRHHLVRLGADPRELAERYVNACVEIHEKTETPIEIYVPLPIEHEERKIPKTGYYKGQPFWGTWEERNRTRNIFIDELKCRCAEHFGHSSNKRSVFVNYWTDYLEDEDRSLMFDKMEKPRSVHLSREHYPYWTGQEPKETGIDQFFS